MKALRSAIEDKQFASAYYLHGEDEFIKEESLRRLLEAAVDPAVRDFNLDVRRGGELDAESLGSLLGMPPMMAERRVVVIRDVAALRKDARAVLDRHLAAPSPDLLIVLVAAADAKTDTKNEKALTASTVAVDCKPPTGAQVPRWIVGRVEKSFGTTIAPAAVELLQNSVGDDLGQLAVELDKVRAFTQGGPIDEAAIVAVVGVRRDETPSRLLDAVAMRDRTLALSLIPGVLQQPKTSAVQLVMALTTQTLALAIARARAIAPSRQSGEFFSLLRAGSSNFTMRSWGEAVSAWPRAYARWSAEDLDHALEVLLRTDLALKNSRVSSDEQVLASAVHSICGGAPNRIAA